MARDLEILKCLSSDATNMKIPLNSIDPWYFDDLTVCFSQQFQYLCFEYLNSIADLHVFKKQICCMQIATYLIFGVYRRCKATIVIMGTRNI